MRRRARGRPVMSGNILERVPRKPPVRLFDRPAPGVPHVADDRAALRRKRRACGETGRILLAVALLGHRTAALELHAFEGIDELEIDHPGERVRAVDGGRTAGQDLHAADQRRRQDVQVDRSIAIGRHQPPSVEQHQCAVGAETAQRHVGLAVVRGRVRRGTGRRHELGIRNERRSIEIAPVCANACPGTVTIGLGELKSARAMREPVTTIISSRGSSAIALPVPVSRTASAAPRIQCAKCYSLGSGA